MKKNPDEKFQCRLLNSITEFPHLRIALKMKIYYNFNNKDFLFLIRPSIDLLRINQVYFLNIVSNFIVVDRSIPNKNKT